MSAKDVINSKIEQIERIGRAEIIRIVRDILRKHKEPSIFTMSMGAYVFEDKAGKNLYDEKYTREIEDFLCDLDLKFGFTGCPLRMFKDGSIDKSY